MPIDSGRQPHHVAGQRELWQKGLWRKEGDLGLEGKTLPTKEERNNEHCSLVSTDESFYLSSEFSLRCD